ncbi:MAG: succinate dehydrogenase, cytochrome b556 subunit [Alphaproteobacteria bacterium]|nr:succinate dehydrogenase, cytochrome b556 subunit [Alphaproteobacteria bacterium]
MAQKQAVSPAHRPRPLSPHLQIYRWPVTMGTSILHRITGVGLSLGAFLIAWWLIAAAAGPDAYGTFLILADHWVGRFVLLGFTLSLVYHLLNGIRHLFWDVGAGFRVRTANATGRLVYGLTILVTLAIWLAGYWVKGDLG